MSVPTYAVVPPFLVAFIVLAYLHWRGTPKHHIVDLRFLMMSAAILLMFAQILLAGSFPVVSLVCCALGPLAMASTSTAAPTPARPPAMLATVSEVARLSMALTNSEPPSVSDAPSPT